MTPYDAQVVDRFLFDTALSFVWGGGGLVLVTPRQVRTRLQSALRTPFAMCGLVACIAGAAALPIQAASIGSDWTSAGQRDILAAVALQTHTGISLAISAAGVGVALAVATAFDRPRTSVLISCLALGGLATRGHSAGLSGAAGWTQLMISAVHVLSATAWVGALIPFILLVRMSASQADGAVVAMKRFSRFGHVAVALVLTTGIANAVLVLGRLPIDWSSPYQWKLSWKIAVALAMTCMALANRYLFVPMRGTHPITSRSLLVAGCCAEILLGLSAFALVASLGLDDPN
jgi:putative copper resistance protein D